MRSVLHTTAVNLIAPTPENSKLLHRIHEVQEFLDKDEQHGLTTEELRELYQNLSDLSTQMASRRKARLSLMDEYAAKIRETAKDSE